MAPTRLVRTLKLKLSLRPACQPTTASAVVPWRSENSLSVAAGSPLGSCLGTFSGQQHCRRNLTYSRCITHYNQSQLQLLGADRRTNMGDSRDASARRLRALAEHISPAGQQNQSRSYSQAVTGCSSDIDFSALSKLLPHDGPEGEAVWYVVVAAALMAFHREAAVGALWEHIVSTRPTSTEEERALIARRIRESCLKASVLVGFPRGINALSSLHGSLASHTPSTHRLLSADSSLRSPVDGKTKLERGTAFFTRLYAGHTNKILDNMSRSSGGDLSYYALASVYGELMAETRVVNAMETVLMEFVCCLADDVAPQAKGHFFGSRNMGASGARIKGAVSIVQDLARQAGLDVPGTGEEYAFLAKADSW
ncbi:hypothetical protein MGYG_07537 [Nannizzia gypsea CBS 118893]|uniref:Uncharacterized protein n=1 Tax=Arthroderma gypseum (strain ATCC MYA-4604 / CBS 118893) TaxID=535722 RepID=E4V3F8_ARTGP|nr:hypothetical protein MGYG_07537 [Nannizzia gypsea CBS 118893]EFR04532.1 hypothetical protein MGYG_07537 [Nannizzia gypsea CBS 118893]